MMPDHARIFLAAAAHVPCWIIVRPSNCRSDFYLPATNCEAKPLSCKAKTANNYDHKLAGLVVSPKMVKEAFRTESLKGVLKQWEKQEEKIADSNSGYRVVQNGDFQGCLTHHGRYLHSDYDLLAVIPLDADHKPRPNDPSSIPRAVENADGEVHFLSPVVAEVMQYFNSRVPRPLVRHGADFDDMAAYRPGIELCDWFGPGGRHERKLYVGEKKGYLH